MRNHFYHVSENRSCRQSNKSIHHLHFQKEIQKILPPKDSKMEMIFLDILRIADVVWISQKIIFEIQCSRICEWEIKNRTRDYECLGYTVVWILDDRIFNKRKVPPHELCLRRHLSFYAAKFGPHAFFYDQHEVIKNDKRIYKGRRCKIDLQTPHSMSLFPYTRRLPAQAYYRLRNHSHFFANDLMDTSRKNLLYAPEKLWKMKLIEKGYRKYFWKRLLRRLWNAYLQTLETIAESID